MKKIFFLLFVIVTINIISKVDFYEMENKGYIKNPKIVENGIVFTDNLANTLYIYTGNSLKIIRKSPGCGQYYQISEDRKYIGFKIIDPNTQLQIPALYDMQSEILIKLSKPVENCSQIAFTTNSTYAYMIDRQLIINDNGVISKYTLKSFSNIISLSPDKKYLIFRDKSERIWLFNLQDDSYLQVTPDKQAYYAGKWASDSSCFYFYDIANNIYTYYLKTKQIIKLRHKGAINWLDSEYLLINENLFDGEKFIESHIVKIKRDGSEEINLYFNKNSLSFGIDYLNGKVLYSLTHEQKIISAQMENNTLIIKNSLSLSNKLSLASFPMKPAKKGKLNITVPYVHQMYDTPQGYAHNYGCCAAATATMALTYYKIFPFWDTTNNSPSSHTTHWGNYIGGTVYQYRSVCYNDTAYYSSGAGYCYNGIDNFHWTTGSPNSRMRLLLQNHGITSVQHWDPNTTYALISGDISIDYPYPICVTMTSSGHLILAKGIYDNANKLLYYNDPYGNKNTSPYLGYDGDDVIYDWPGENHGYANLQSVAWSVSDHYVHQATPGLEIDDLQLAYGSSYEDYSDTNCGFYLYTGGTGGMRYWRGETGGLNGTYWWTGAMNTTSDDYHASWRPNITESGTYEVKVYIPLATGVATNANYKIYHNAGMSLVQVDQSAHTGSWVSLGQYDFSNDDSGYLYLGDGIGSKGKSSSKDDTRADKLLFDSAKFNLVSGNSVTIYDNDLESDNGGLSSNTDWTWGTDTTASAHSGNNVWGTILNADYNNRSDLHLDLSVSLAENCILTFFQWMQIEDVAKADVFDGANLKISTDGGNNFDLIYPNGGYPHTIKYSAYNPLSNEQGYSGVTTGWEEATFDLSSYANTNAIIRWHFGSDGATTEHGWYIDDINITSYPEQPLPVTLSYFSGLFVNEGVSINWTTQTETNNSHWNIYRSLSKNFGQAYKINNDAISGTGNSNQPVDYVYSDISLPDEFNTLWYWIESVNFAGISDTYGPIFVDKPGIDNPIPPGICDLKTNLTNYPNPFNPNTTISFNITQKNAREIKVEIYNLLGQKIRSLDYDLSNSGYEIGKTMFFNWNGQDQQHEAVSSGTYLYRLKIDNHIIDTKKCLLIK